jgi:hypothetical protein
LFVFVRLVPAISMFEMRELVSEPHPLQEES